MKARTVDALAAQIGRPPKALAAFSKLTPDQVQVLSEALEDAAERERQAIARAATSPAGVRSLVALFLRNLAR